MTLDDNRFGQMLRLRRLDAGLSQEELAARAGLSARGISDLERGINRRPHLETVRLLAAALALSEAEIAAFQAAARPFARQQEDPASPAAPAFQTSFIGRSAELEFADGQLASTQVRLLSLVGPGGVGKTRLALEVAAQVRGRFAGGVYFVDLTSLRDAAQVPTAVAQALGVTLVSSQPVAERIIEHLRQLQLLLVLDNFEHLLPAALFLAGLLAECPGLKVLVTSRAPLHISGEVEFQVEPLATPDLLYLPDARSIGEYPAVELFLQRARALNHEFAITMDNAAAIAEICTRLDGLPLAIELAAARTKLLSPQAIARRLDHGMRVLGSGPVDVSERQRSLSSTLDWSHGLLAEREQALLRRLAVFAGGWSLDGVIAVCGLEEAEAIEAMSSLLDNSLIRAAAPGETERYRMLETIHEYAAEKLQQSGETSALRQRHLAYVTGLVERERAGLHSPAWQEALANLNAELDNIRAALAYSIEDGLPEYGLRILAAILWFWTREDMWLEGREWCQRLLAQSQGHDDSAAFARVVMSVGAVSWFLGELKLAEDELERARPLLTAHEDNEGLAEMLFFHGICRLTQGDALAADVDLAESVRLFGVAGNHYDETLSRYVLGDVATRSDLVKARSLYERSLADSRASGDVWGIANCVVALGHLSLNEGDVEQAERLCREGLELRRSLDEAWGIATGAAGLGEVLRRRGDFSGAIDVLEEALATFTQLGNREHISWAEYNLGRVALAEGDLGAASEKLGRSLELSQEQSLPRLRLCLVALAELALKTGRVDLAARLSVLTELWAGDGAVTEAADQRDVDQSLAQIKAAFGAGPSSDLESSFKDLDSESLLSQALSLAREVQALARHRHAD